VEVIADSNSGIEINFKNRGENDLDYVVDADCEIFVQKVCPDCGQRCRWK
jgi:hypothetical protein